MIKTNWLIIGPCPPLHGLGVLQPKSFWDIWDLSDYLSARVALRIQWVPGHAELSDNELTDLLAKTGTTRSFAHVSSPLAPVIAKIRHIRYSTWRGIFLTTLSLLPDSFGFLGGTILLPSHPLWTVQTSLPRSQLFLLLLFMQDKTKGELFLQRLRSSPARSNSPPFGLSRIWASAARHLWHYFFNFNLWSKSWGV